jgi:hypothetical protein
MSERDIPKAPADPNLTKKIRAMKICSSQCPMFDECLLMPLAIKPQVQKDRICLVNYGSRDLRMSYINLLLGEQDGLIEEIKRCFLSYVQESELIEKEAKKKGSVKLTIKDRDRLLVHREKMMAMLMKLHDLQYGQKKTNDGKDKIQKIRLVEIGADGEKVTVVKDETPMTKTEKAEFEILEQSVVDNAVPDPESLVYSEKLRDILPSMTVLKPEVTPEKPAEPGLPEEDPILKQFFPKEKS